MRQKLFWVTLAGCICLLPIFNPALAEANPSGKVTSDRSAGLMDKPKDFQMNIAEQRPRNPFAAPVVQKIRTGKKESTDKKEIVFDGSTLDIMVSNMQSVRWDHVPRIRVTGLMEVDGEIAVCADVAGIGMTVLRTNERILIGRGGTNHKPGESPWFLVKEINRRNMTIQLDDGTLIQGKFF